MGRIQTSEHVSKVIDAVEANDFVPDQNRWGGTRVVRVRNSSEMSEEADQRWRDGITGGVAIGSDVY